MTSGPQVGDPAPDFALQGTAGVFRLSEHGGGPVVLLFYPGDETTVCTKQFCSYRDRREDMAGLQATVVGISHQGLDSHRSFTERHGLTVPLLADEDRRVAMLYGVAAPVIGTRRATFVVDQSGIVRHRRVHTLGLRFEDADDLRAALAAL